MTSPGHAATVLYPDFGADQSGNVPGMTLTGNATPTATQDGNVLRLVKSQVGQQSGDAFKTAAIDATTFSTAFHFRMTAPGGLTPDPSGGTGGDGLTFILQTVSSSQGGTGGGVGYGGINQSLGVKFDTYQNTGNNDPNSNFVGIYKNGNITNALATTGIASLTPFDNGDLWTVWVDYNGTTLEVRWADNSDVRPGASQLSVGVDLKSILGASRITQTYVGFGAGTASHYENVDVQGWQYNDSYSPIITSPVLTNVPEPSAYALTVLTSVCGWLALTRRRS